MNEPRDVARSICWMALWNDAHRGVGLEHVLLHSGAADASLLAIDDDGTAFRLHYRLAWDPTSWRLRRADLVVRSSAESRSLVLETDGEGHWQNDAGPLEALDGCIDIDIWPTPFTNTFPIRRTPLAIGQRREFAMAWVAAPALTVTRVPQAYTRLSRSTYLFENLDGSGFRAELPVDDEAFVLDYPGLFRRIDAR